MTLEELKLEADKLGLNYSPNIGKETLQAKLAEFKSKPVEKPITVVEGGSKVEVVSPRRKVKGIGGSRLVRITSKDPSEVTVTSQYASVMNAKMSAVVRPVPLGKDIFLPQIIIDNLMETKISQPRDGENGNGVDYNLVNKYVVDYLD
jgi:hypothetical protein